ncbi:transposable element Tc1 transposase [Trichonephila clavipes]|nr:transposable element Tc1 transposase [Trichonephila clavipes]
MCSVRKISLEEKPEKKPFISKRNQKVRLEFAKEHENKDFSYWKQILFTDESKFNIFGSDGKPYVWRKSNEELHRQNMNPTVTHGGGSVMDWGLFSAAGPRTLYFIQDNDPKHKAYKVRFWLLYNYPRVMETPPQSPDINPIENLWNHLNKTAWEMRHPFGGVRGTPRNSSACKQNNRADIQITVVILMERRPPSLLPSLRLTKPK